MADRTFTRDEANALVPYLSLELARIGRLRPEIASLTEALGGAEQALAYLEGAEVPEARGAAVARLLAITREIRAAVDRVSGTGAVLKDLDLGLVDFHGRVGGKTVLLCWQLGEPEVAHFHELDAGFDRRQPLPARPGAAPALKH